MTCWMCGGLSIGEEICALGQNARNGMPFKYHGGVLEVVITPGNDW